MKAPQNIYDNPAFFAGYKKLRENPDCANIVEEKPALFSLIPNLQGKSVLDLGCGYGENCREFSQLGAKAVLGVDISEKMLKIAKRENPDLSFIRLDMSDLSSLGQKFDVAFSSLAVHYVEDFNRFVSSVYNLLNDGGYFIFSQEHPLSTAPISGAGWAKDENGKVLHYKLTDYAVSGERKTDWIVDDVIKYHRTFSELINTLVANGFTIEKILEPVASPETMAKLRGYRKSLHKPNFLLIKVKKQKECDKPE